VSILTWCFDIWEEEPRMYPPKGSILYLPTDAGDLRVTDDGASPAVLLSVLGALVSEEIQASVTVLEIELGLPMNISIHIIAIAFDFPVVTAVPIALVPKGRHLLSASDRALEIRV
jgi:hypothetical protein